MDFDGTDIAESILLPDDSLDLDSRIVAFNRVGGKLPTAAATASGKKDRITDCQKDQLFHFSSSLSLRFNERSCFLFTPIMGKDQYFRKGYFEPLFK